jgi:hypothetical protein
VPAALLLLLLLLCWLSDGKVLLQLHPLGLKVGQLLLLLDHKVTLLGQVLWLL